MGELIAQFAGDLAAGRYTLDEKALEDGGHSVVPAAERDACNGYQSPTWRHAWPG